MEAKKQDDEKEAAATRVAVNATAFIEVAGMSGEENLTINEHVQRGLLTLEMAWTVGQNMNGANQNSRMYCSFCGARLRVKNWRERRPAWLYSPLN